MNLPFASPRFSDTARGESVSNYSRKILDTIATASNVDVTTLLITSTTRTPEDQARIMYEQLGNGTISRYGSTGRAVIDIYHDSIKNGNDARQTRNAMRDTIQKYLDNGQRVSNHLGDPKVLNVFNISPTSISKDNIKTWEETLSQALDGNVISTYLGPRTRVYDSAYHIEINQPKNH